MEDDRSSNDETMSTSSSDGVMEYDETITDPIERLLYRNRSERMRELRKIQHSHRPVSLGHAKEKLESLLSTTDASTSNQVQQFRPDSIHVEVHGLSEQQRVTSILGSLSFRNALEAVISRHTRNQSMQPTHESVLESLPGQLQPLPETVIPPPTTIHSTVQQPQAEQLHVEVHGLSEQQPVTSTLGSLGFRNALETVISRHTRNQSMQQAAQLTHQYVTESHPGQPQASLLHNTQTLPDTVIPSPPPPPPPPHSRVYQSQAEQPQDSSQQSQPGMIRIPPPPPTPAPAYMTRMQGQTSNGDRSDGVHMSAEDWFETQRHNRESIVDSIQALLQQQLVSSMLSSNFRNTLEIHIQNRVHETGGGEHVEQFVRGLAARYNHRRFRQSSPETQPRGSNATSEIASNEIAILKNEIDEMKRMVQVSFEMQLNIQRSIKQEIAAVFAAAMSGMLTSPHSSVAGNQAQATQGAEPRITSPAQEGTCIICLEHSTDTVLYQCGHMCVCHACGLHLKMQGLNCPICRAPIVDIIRAYKTT